MTDRPNLLVVCSRNKKRSRTAEYIFKNDMCFSIRSVGLSPKSPRQIKEKDIEWADLICVMENKHKSRINSSFRDMDIPPIEVFYIDDIYEYRDPDLIELLTDNINMALERYFGV